MYLIASLYRHEYLRPHTRDLLWRRCPLLSARISIQSYRIALLKTFALTIDSDLFNIIPSASFGGSTSSIIAIKSSLDSLIKGITRRWSFKITSSLEAPGTPEQSSLYTHYIKAMVRAWQPTLEHHGLVLYWLSRGMSRGGLQRLLQRRTGKAVSSGFVASMASKLIGQTSEAGLPDIYIETDHCWYPARVDDNLARILHPREIANITTLKATKRKMIEEDVNAARVLVNRGLEQTFKYDDKVFTGGVVVHRGHYINGDSTPMPKDSGGLFISAPPAVHPKRPNPAIRVAFGWPPQPDKQSLETARKAQLSDGELKQAVKVFETATAGALRRGDKEEYPK